MPDNRFISEIRSGLICGEFYRAYRRFALRTLRQDMQLAMDALGPEAYPSIDLLRAAGQPLSRSELERLITDMSEDQRVEFARMIETSGTS